MLDACTLAAIRAIVREELAVALRPAPRRALAARDRDWLVTLLPAIDAAAGDTVRTTAELAGLALRRDCAALAAALASYVSRPGGLRGLGKALARGVGHHVGGFELRHVGNASGNSLWQVVRVSNPRQTHETIAAATAPPCAAATSAHLPRAGEHDHAKRP